tara:strand:+ start:311 stop:622 length:312 start_codon:yes stop_codon:yes gene_type:complete
MKKDNELNSIFKSIVETFEAIQQRMDIISERVDVIQDYSNQIQTLSQEVISEKEPKYYNIKIHLTESDLQDLQEDRSFHWNFQTDENEDVIIKVNLIKGEGDE